MAVEDSADGPDQKRGKQNTSKKARKPAAKAKSSVVDEELADKQAAVGKKRRGKATQAQSKNSQRMPEPEIEEI